MLYQTHHPNFFQFHTFTCIPPSATTTISLLSPFSSSSSSVLKEMECIEAALKTSLRKELSLKLNPQAVLDDIWAENFQNGAPSDDNFADDFLDFSNEDCLAEQQEPREEEQKKLSLSVSPKQEQQHGGYNYLEECLNFDDLGPIPANEIIVPVDELANLEWLSHFVEDSEYSSPFPAGILPVKLNDNGSGAETPAIPSPCFKTPVPAKARSKRTRSGGRVWSLGSPSLSDSSSSSTTSSSSCPSSPVLINPASLSSLGPAEPFPSEKPPKKKKKISLTQEFKDGGDSNSGNPFVRRCSHCGVQKTPQWRAGPLGSKTLCNACGVRYKSGRLYPEYRPACSPTFSSELHSNHHRKVLEMRRKKELLPAEPSLAPPVVPSF